MTIHKPVLLKETIEMLNLKEDSIVVDATLGGAGHSREILKIITKGKLIAFDADKQAIENFTAQADDRVILINDNFTNLENILADLKIEKVDAILADLGWSLDQLEGKGMSFQKDEKLDMRLDCNQRLDAQKMVNEFSEQELGRIIRDYGEEKFWKNIAKQIIKNRIKKKIETTKQLAQIIQNAVPAKFQRGKINPATKTFQALRIAVNQELDNSQEFLPQAINVLNSEGRLAVISFHSLEDRIVKVFYRENARGCICPPNFPQCACGQIPEVAIITKKPVIAGEEEVAQNSRARSAKLRVCEKK